jgi:hypothetical protein
VKQKRFFGCVILVVVFALTVPAAASAGGTSICSSDSAMTGTTCGLAMTKSGPQIAHVGDTITYSYSVTSTGEIAPTVDKTTGVVDDKCAPVTYVSGDNGDGKVDPDETWMFTCKYTVKAADVDAQSNVVNTATVTGTVCKNGEKKTVTATATWTTHIITPAITVTKSAAESSVTQGGTINYTITVNNTGTADLTLTPQDAGCTGFDATPFTLAVGASKTLTCSHLTTASNGSQYTNQVCVSGSDTAGGQVNACAQVTTPITPPTTTTSTPPAATPPAQVVLGQRTTPGTARLLGRTGCVTRSFYARVRGAQITRVVFVIDGKVVKTVTKPNLKGAFAVRINPRNFKLGLHRIVARVRFTSGSGTRAKVLRLGFQRCAKPLVSPRFTG